MPEIITLEWGPRGVTQKALFEAFDYDPKPDLGWVQQRLDTTEIGYALKRVPLDGKTALGVTWHVHTLVKALERGCHPADSKIGTTWSSGFLYLANPKSVRGASATNQGRWDPNHEAGSLLLLVAYAKNRVHSGTKGQILVPECLVLARRIGWFTWNLGEPDRYGDTRGGFYLVKK